MSSDRAKKWTGDEVKLFATLIVAILLSAGGILYAVRWGVADDGGRGGAIAVALTFLMLFLGPDTPRAVLDATHVPTGDTRRDEQVEAARVPNALSAMLDWGALEKKYLAAASVIGTLVWGFGDILARCLGAPQT